MKWFAIGVVACGMTASTGVGQVMELVRPSNTGIPGEEVRTVQLHPDGRLWVGARWPFWGEGGVGIYDIAGDLWETHSNAETGSGPGPIPGAFVSDLAFESDGTAWIATDQGLVRYDGSAWTVYDSSNTPMAFNNCVDVCVGPDGHIWVNNSDFNQGGDSVLEFDGTNWTRYRTGIEMPWDTVWQDLGSVFAASSGDIWVTNRTLGGAARRHNGVWALHGANLGSFEEIAEDTAGNLYFAPGLGQSQLAKWDGSAMSVVYSQLDIMTVSTDSDGAVYFGDWHGNVRRSFNQGVSWQLFISGLNQVFNVVPNPAGDDLWIGTIGAVGHFDAAGQLLKDYNTITTGMPDYFCEQFSLGQTSGDFYIASAETGASAFDGLRWSNIGSHNPNIDWPALADGADSVYEARDGRLWVGTNGILRWDRGTGATDLWDWRNTDGMGVTNFLDFAEDKHGTLWAFEQYGAAWSFNAQTQVWTRDDHFMYAALGIPGAAADSAGNIYWGGWFDIALWDGTAWADLTLPYADFLYDLGGADCLAVGPDDTLWVGCPDGLAHYDAGVWTVYDTTNTPMPIDAVTGIDFRPDGLMGITLSDLDDRPNCGAAVIDGEITDPDAWTFALHGNTPMPHPQINGCVFDANGDLWVSCVSEAAAVIKVGAGPCPGDFNGDGLANTLDVLAFLNAWSGGDPRGDFNGDGSTNTIDVLGFLNAWSTGC
jgi:hypothetical protein